MNSIDRVMRTELQEVGRVWLRNILTEDDLCAFESAIPANDWPGGRLGASPQMEEVLSGKSAFANALDRLRPHMKPVRIVYFNKSRLQNWALPWHQDRVIAVRERHETAGFGNWTRKAGVWHCEPPRHLLQDMLFVRFHLDDTDGENGGMQIALGSHGFGVVAANETERQAQSCPIETCKAKRGDVLILNMLMLHRSLPSQVASARRVFRADFSCGDLPPPLQWVL